jgi:hypothetical protein
MLFRAPRQFEAKSPFGLHHPFTVNQADRMASVMVVWAQVTEIT